MLLFPTSVVKIHQILSYLAAQPGTPLPIATLQRDLLALDALHLSDWGRPLTADQWQATTAGPLGRTLTGLLNGEPVFLGMMSREERRQVPAYLLHDFALTLDEADARAAERMMNDPERLTKTYGRLSESDRICLDALKSGTEIDGLADARARADRAWRGHLGNTIPYNHLLTPEQQTDDDVLDELWAKAGLYRGVSPVG
jgi:hypothetical protein